MARPIEFRTAAEIAAEAEHAEKLHREFCEGGWVYRMPSKGGQRYDYPKLCFTCVVRCLMVVGKVHRAH